MARKKITELSFKGWCLDDSNEKQARQDIDIEIRDLMKSLTALLHDLVPPDVFNRIEFRIKINTNNSFYVHGTSEEYIAPDNHVLIEFLGPLMIGYRYLIDKPNIRTIQKTTA